MKAILHRIRYPFHKTHILEDKDSLGTAIKVARKGDKIYLREVHYENY